MSTVILYTIDMSHVCLFHDWPCHLGMIYSGNQMMRRFLFTCSELNHIFSLSSVHPTLSTELFVLVFFVSLPGQWGKIAVKFHTLLFDCNISKGTTIFPKRVC